MQNYTSFDRLHRMSFCLNFVESTCEQATQRKATNLTFHALSFQQHQ